MRATTEALSQVTNLLAIVTAPPIHTAVIRHVEVLLLQPQVVMVVVITSTGGVSKRLLTFERPVDPGIADWAASYLNEKLAGMGLGARMLAGKLADAGLGATERAFVDRLRPAFAELAETAEDTLYVDGAARLLSEHRFQDMSQINDLMDFLERRVALLGLLQDALAQRAPYVRIGQENAEPALRSLSLVAANYGLPARNLGTVSVIGPLAMDYAMAISSVRDAAGALSRFVEQVYEDYQVPRDYYEVLGVGRDAADADIKKAFRRLARELHPDVNRHDPEAETKFKEAAEAYEVLCDADRRRQYDQFGHEGLRSGGYAPNYDSFGSVSDLFNAFFGGGGFDAAFGQGRGRTTRGIQGGDVAVATQIAFVDSARGVTVDVAFDAIAACETCLGNGAKPGTPIETCTRCRGIGQIQNVARTRFGQLVRSQTCPACEGEGRVPTHPCESCGGRGRAPQRTQLKVEVPPGIADGQRIRLTGRGHSGERGGPAGDLYVVVRVAEDERFLRDGDDLVTVVDVPAPLAALGTRVVVPTIDGDRELDLAAGTQPGETAIIPGAGMPPLRGGRNGDLRVVINVVIPRRLNREQKDLLQQLAGTINEDNMRSDEGMFSKLKRALGG